jgi:hypothetical protein
VKDVIDYRNGAGGNTILAHILFACKKVDTALDNITSPTDGHGNVHLIYKHNNTNLDARHYNESYYDECNIVLEIKTHDWSELLKTKFSYEKWHGAYPTVENYKQFFNFDLDNFDNAWQEFYANYKDPSWPVCESYADVKLLPKFIQEEIDRVYEPPVVEVTKDNFVELIQKSYKNQLQYCKQTHLTPFNNSKIYELGEYYFDQNFDTLKEVAELLGWSWDKAQSDTFYSWALKMNKNYLIWLDQMKEQCYNNSNKFTLDWEVAFLNAIKEHIGEYSGQTI